MNGMNKSTYVALLELRPLEGCVLDPKETAGAFVRCYVTAISEDEALQKVYEAINEDSFSVEKVEWCVDSSQVEWDNPDDAEAMSCLRQAENSGDVIYGRFDSWGYEDDAG